MTDEELRERARALALQAWASAGIGTAERRTEDAILAALVKIRDEAAACDGGCGKPFGSHSQQCERQQRADVLRAEVDAKKAALTEAAQLRQQLAKAYETTAQWSQEERKMRQRVEAAEDSWHEEQAATNAAVKRAEAAERERDEAAEEIYKLRAERDSLAVDWGKERQRVADLEREQSLLRTDRDSLKIALDGAVRDVLAAPSALREGQEGKVHESPQELAAAPPKEEPPTCGTAWCGLPFEQNPAKNYVAWRGRGYCSDTCCRLAHADGGAAHPDRSQP